MASDLKTTEVCRIFQLKYDWAKIHEDPWTLTCELHTPPESLCRPHSLFLTCSVSNCVADIHLQEFYKARYDPNCEATSRIAADLVIITCSLKPQQIHHAHYGRRNLNPAGSDGLLTLYPELNLSTMVSDPTKHTPLRISGRADWGVGYGARTADGGKRSYVIAVKDKSPSELPSAE